MCYTFIIPSTLGFTAFIPTYGLILLNRYLADAVIPAIGHIEIARFVYHDARGEIKPGRRSNTIGIAFRSASSKDTGSSLFRELEDAMIVGVCHIKVSCLVYRNVARRVVPVTLNRKAGAWLGVVFR